MKFYCFLKTILEKKLVWLHFTPKYMQEQVKEEPSFLRNF